MKPPSRWVSITSNSPPGGVADLLEPVAERILGDDADHLSRRIGRVVAEEVGAVHRLLEGVERARREHLHAAAGTGLDAVLLHRRAKAVPVEAAVPLGGEGLEELRREAVGGVELGRIGARHRRPALPADAGEQLLDAVEAAVDRGQERLLLALDHARHARRRLAELRVGVPHHVGHHGRQPVEERLPHPHLPAVEHGPAQEPLDDVLLLVVAGQDVLMDRERAGPHVVGDPPHPPAVVAGRLVPPAAHVGHGLHERPEDVDVEVGVHPLQHGAGPLQAHAGVDVAAGQRLQVVGRRADAVELREYEVPDLDVAAVGHPVEDLAARPADAVGPLAGGARRPEVVVLAHPRDLRRQHADLVGPDAESLVVVLVDADRELLGGDVQPIPGGEKLPGPVNRFPLEVVAEREVAEHLEERVVPRRAAHVVDIAGPQALLAGRGPGELELALPQEVILELVHARRREQHRRIPAGHEHVARAADAALRLEEGEVGFAKFVGLHRVGGSGRG
jgi:hypothetical protein